MQAKCFRVTNRPGTLCTPLVTAAAILPTFAYGLFSDKPNALAAKVSILVGAVSWSIWAFFVERTTAGMMGVCDAIFGVPYISEGLIGYIDPLVIGLPLSAIALIATILVLRMTGRVEPAAS